MSKKVRARVTHRFEAAAERVFDAWLDPEAVRGWMHPALAAMGLPAEVTEVAIEPRVGGRFALADRRAEGEARHEGTYLALERPTLLRFTWITDPSEQADPSVVTVVIRPEGSGSVVELEHEMDAAWKEWLPQTERGWRLMLEAIGELLAGRG